MKGGHANSGPPPDPNAMRRDRGSDQASWVTLPEDGREGPTPEWPLSRPTAREKAMWAAEWLRPQAVMWERLGLHRSVAIHVRTSRRAEHPKATAALLTAVRQQEEELGISPSGLARRRWVIGVPAAQKRQQATGTEGRSVRDRLTSIEGGRDG